MKISDTLWVQALVRKSLGHSDTHSIPMQVITHSLMAFVDELCTLMMEYSSHFNELVHEENPDAVCQVFRLGSPRPGLMMLRGKDKMVVAAEGARIRCRVMHVHAYNEHVIDALEFEGFPTREGDVVWVSLSDNQRVTPELLAKLYLGRFLAHGCAAYESQRKGASREAPQSGA